MTPRTLCMIVGSAYSGSTLLTALLDRYQSVTAVGEAGALYGNHHAVEKQFCWRCKVVASECDLWSRWDRQQPLYQFIMAHVPGRVVVDSTKDPVRMVEQWQKAANYPATIKAIHISKSPLEQVGSYYKHQEWRLPRGRQSKWTAEECVDHWLATNIWYVGYLLQNRIQTLRITYSDFAKCTENTLAMIADFLGLSGDELAATDSHTIGGNPSVSAIASGDETRYGPQGKTGYMNGKYANSSSELEITYDDSWSELPDTFSSAVSAELIRRIRDVSPLMQMLGHAPIQEQI